MTKAPIRPVRTTQVSRPLTARSAGVLLLIGFTIQVMLRVTLIHGRNGPLVFADETGYLANARVLAGGVPGQLSHAMFYRAGYSVLLVPAYLLSDNPVRSYHLVLGTNALISSCTFPLLFLLLRRVLSVGRSQALAAAFVAAAAPALLLVSLLAMAETLLTPLYLLVLYALARLVADGKSRWGVVLGAAGGWLPTTHGRGGLALALLAGALAAAVWRRRELLRPVLTALLVAGILYLLGGLLNSYVRNLNFPGSSGGGSQVLNHLGSPGVAKNVAALALGQYWYFTVASAGLFGLGVIGLVAAIRKQGRCPTTPREQAASLVCWLELAALLGFTVLTAVFLYPPNRPDIVVYGRYTEFVVPFVTAAGLARLWHPLPWRRLVLEMAAVASLTTLAVLLLPSYANGLVDRKLSNIYNTLALPGLSASDHYIRLGRATLVALAVFAVAGILLRRRWLLGALCLVGLSVWSAFFTIDSMFANGSRIYGPKQTDFVSLPGIQRGEQVGYDLDSYTIEGLWSFQWQEPKAHFILYRTSSGRRPTTRLVITSRRWTSATRYGAQLVWTDPLRDQAVWELPAWLPISISGE